MEVINKKELIIENSFGKEKQNVAEFPVLVSVSNGSEADAIDLILVVQESKSGLSTLKKK